MFLFLKEIFEWIDLPARMPEGFSKFHFFSDFSPRWHIVFGYVVKMAIIVKLDNKE